MTPGLNLTGVLAVFLSLCGNLIGTAMDAMAAAVPVTEPLSGPILGPESGPSSGPALEVNKKENSGKKVIALTSIKNIQIELPDQSMHNFGEDYQASLITQLTQSGRYIVTDAKTIDLLPEIKVESLTRDYVWPASVTPSATLRIEVEALSFQTGLRGDQMFYGFDERFRTPFNDGSGQVLNEFPLKSVSIEPSWFGDTFDGKGDVPFDSHSGLDLGDGFDIDALFAWLSVKYARYHTELHLRLGLNGPLGGATEYRKIQVAGDGFFFDVSGAYQGYSAGISVARRDAMEQAVKKALDASVSAIDHALIDLPLMAKVDAVLSDGTVLIGTGPFSEIPPGTLYEEVNHPDAVVEVLSSVSSGSLGHVIAGDPSVVTTGSLFRQITSQSLSGSQIVNRSLGGQAGAPVEAETIVLPPENLPPAQLGGLVVTVSRWQAFLKSVAESIFLPYRIWRYFTYDQTYHKESDLGLSPSDYGLEKDPWAQQIGLAQAPMMEVSPSGDAANVASPIVAVMDSGVDYNHPVLHHALWLNPDPLEDPEGRKDRYGWDYVSGDSRPFDDGYHGTQIASLISTVAPVAKIMPIKVFNPWGITTSAMIYSGFVYAVDHGAQIIVCGWSTTVNSQAIRMGVSYAKEHGVIVVAAAGDQGVSLERWGIYPAVLGRTYDNLLPVTGVNGKDQLFQDGYRKANYDATWVKIAAPAMSIRVAEPRMGQSKESSTGLSAAIVAGVLARNLAAHGLSGSYSDWISELLGDADPIPGLMNSVRGGLRVHVRR